MSNGLVTLSDILRTAAARTVVGTVNVLANVAFACSLAPVVVTLVVVHDFLVVFCHVLSLLVFFLFLSLAIVRVRLFSLYL
ncbi:MAG: hypothetical protein L7S02_01340, partial [Flavobacteriales bacterium]|nr:hypothetical protein [Flavobacteriales bacterium]